MQLKITLGVVFLFKYIKIMFNLQKHLTVGYEPAADLTVHPPPQLSRVGLFFFV